MSNLHEMKMKDLRTLGDELGVKASKKDDLIAEILEAQGANLVGFTSVEGYEFESSRALRGDQFIGLAIDYENQGSMNKERIAAWVDQLKKEFT